MQRHAAGEVRCRLAAEFERWWLRRHAVRVPTRPGFLFRQACSCCGRGDLPLFATGVCAECAVRNCSPQTHRSY
jgi:hypothetical protein